MSSTQSKTDGQTEKRSDVSEHEGERKYGDVAYADETNKKYPIDTPEHIRAAWNYIHHPDNASKYDTADVEKIKARIQHAAGLHNVQIKVD